MNTLKSIGAYLHDRLGETSTWVGLSGAIIAAGAATAPWSYIGALVGVVGVLMPDRRKCR